MGAHWLLPDQPFASYRDYSTAMGGNAVERARGMSPDEVMAEIDASGLRGRGGAGFPTGTTQGNRCYLPVQGSLLLPSLLARLSPRRGPPWQLPRIVDFDELAGRFLLAEEESLKEPSRAAG
jgi:hypothetical protein